MAVSIKQIAELAGVSIYTVSKSLNNADARIPEHTRERVRRIAVEAGYRPNHFAQSLRAQRTNTVGLLLPALSNPFFAAVAQQLEDSLRKSGYSVVLDAPPFYWGLDYDWKKLRGWPLDGLLAWLPTNNEVPESAREIRPAVYLGYPHPASDNDVVYFDLYEGGRQAAVHLIERGYRRIAQVAMVGEDERARAFRETMSASAIMGGKPPRDLPVQWNELTRAVGFALGGRLAEEPPAVRPDAIFCHNDIFAISMIHGLRRGGVRVPEDIAILGFDGIEEGLYLERSLTTIETPIGELCEAAVALLLKRMQSRDATLSGPRLSPQQIRIVPRLRSGETS